ncbi:MAG: hypothetical protein JWN74_2298 [Acidobacteriaceae bacterium]|nr:hypothetical protein [Acidobacteriaceae bacterium]
MKYLKLSTDGPNGSGKTCTMAQLAAGIAKDYCGAGAVHVYDSSDRWGAWKVHIFDTEKVPLVITVGNSLAALKQSMNDFLKAKGAVYVADDLTVPWSEGLSTFAYENGNLPFDRRAQLMNEWNRFVLPFQAGEFHAIACGRLGYWWENIEDPDTGEKKLVQGDSKFNAGGGQNFGFECVLEAEMRRRKRRIAGLLRGKTTMEYVCDVVKDADSIINNQQFVFKDFDKGYKQGDYKRVLDCFRPHIEFRAKLGQANRATSTSRDLIVSGKTDWARDQADRKGLIEELDNLLNQCFPGGEKRSKIDTMFRHLTLEYLNGFSSWSRMEDEIETNNLRRNVEIIKKMRARLQAGERITDQNSLVGMLHLSTEDVLHPGKNMTLVELLTSTSANNKNGKPQPVIAAQDAVAEEEIPF